MSKLPHEGMSILGYSNIVTQEKRAARNFGYVLPKHAFSEIVLELIQLDKDLKLLQQLPPSKRVTQIIDQIKGYLDSEYADAETNLVSPTRGNYVSVDPVTDDESCCDDYDIISDCPQECNEGESFMDDYEVCTTHDQTSGREVSGTSRFLFWERKY